MFELDKILNIFTKYTTNYKRWFIVQFSLRSGTSIKILNNFLYLLIILKINVFNNKKIILI